MSRRLIMRSPERVGTGGFSARGREVRENCLAVGMTRWCRQQRIVCAAAIRKRCCVSTCMLQMPTCMLRSQHAILQKSHVNMCGRVLHDVAKLQHACCKISTWRFKHPNMAFQNSEHACYRYEHQCYRYEHACYRCEHGKISVYLSPQKQEHHRHPTVPTHQTRQIPTHNTLVCASRTNNTYTFHALPRKILCQAGTSPKSHCPPAPAW